MMNTNIMTHINASCLKCDTIERYMVVTGALHFCEKCFQEEFKTDHPSKKEREKYLKWLDVYRTKVEL